MSEVDKGRQDEDKTKQPNRGRNSPMNRHPEGVNRNEDHEGDCTHSCFFYMYIIIITCIKKPSYAFDEAKLSFSAMKDMIM